MKEISRSFDRGKKTPALLLAIGVIAAGVYGCGESSNEKGDGITGGAVPANIYSHAPEIIETTATTGKVKIYYDVASGQPPELINEVRCPELWNEQTVESPYTTEDLRAGKTCTTEELSLNQLPRAQDLLANYLAGQQ